jgi:cell division protein FtsX
MVIKRVNPVSAAKIGGVLYGLLGLVIGACVSVVALLFSGAMAAASDQSGSSMFGMLFGAGAIIIMPIFYGVIGFVMTLISAALYNIASKITGGVEIEAA